ncbi:hypothetical protein L3556_03420 [Candidatus Synechococcus calcipolaris G9]|uniref:Uncharacterized protein n=1 Tax=Candidatus Synechococcus calcipolaris G9 TaxID=1497997 RepID=A0ABT6EW24_9SYNE|nr:hypothetical protein [Candidatus Synechococcus calcipolaris]MDG2989987.1 hypothetical protein [Candidatus Synechococcus calcipolaris G9]
MGSIIGFVAIIAYFIGFWRFWQGFDRTHYSQYRLPLAALWPLLLIANKSYRENFSRALKG